MANYLPASMKVPDCQGKPITLFDLATYTSGLPNKSTANDLTVFLEACLGCRQSI